VVALDEEEVEPVLDEDEIEVTAAEEARSSATWRRTRTSRKRKTRVPPVSRSAKKFCARSLGRDADRRHVPLRRGHAARRIGRFRAGAELGRPTIRRDFMTRALNDGVLNPIGLTTVKLDKR